jgi:ABC-type glycerol-3-phosphate transport system substrate-binding protein
VGGAAAVGSLGAAGLAACGAAGTSGTGSGGSGSAAAPVRLGFLMKERSSPAAEDVLRKLIADHNQQNPLVQVETELVASAAVNAQLTTRAASGQAQDFVESGGFLWVGFAEQGMFTELTPLFKRDKLDLKTFLPEAVARR